jgi:hypothetical protein
MIGLTRSQTRDPILGTRKLLLIMSFIDIDITVTSSRDAKTTILVILADYKMTQ